MENQIRCSKCGALNPSSSLYCKSCGSSLKHLKHKCPNCGYPNQKDAKRCVVCGYDFSKPVNRESFRFLSTSQIIGFTLFGVTLLIALIGIFCPVFSNNSLAGSSNYSSQISISYFFNEGWKALLDLRGQASFEINCVEFVLHFLSFFVALTGIICVSIIYISALIKEFKYEPSKLSIRKAYKFFAIFTIPYLALTLFTRYYYLRVSYSQYNDTYIYACLKGVGTYLLSVSLVVGFIAGLFAEYHNYQRSKKDYALGAISTILVVILACSIAGAGESFIIKSGGATYVLTDSIATVLEQFMDYGDIPVAVGVYAFIGTFFLFITLACALSYLWCENPRRKFMHANYIFFGTVLSCLFCYLATYNLHVKYGFWYTNNVTVQVSAKYIFCLISAAMMYAISLNYHILDMKKKRAKAALLIKK